MKTSDQEDGAVQRFFTETASEYAKLFLSKPSGANFGFRERLALATQLTSGMSGRLLDCACGTGEITAAVLAPGRFAAATVVDLSPRMLEVARSHLGTIAGAADPSKMAFVCSDVFEFAGNASADRYDLVLCLGLIAHTGRLDDLLARLKALLAPGGSLLLQSSLLDHLGVRIVRAVTSERYHRRHGYRISYFRHDDILQAAKKAGLRIAFMRRFTFGFPFGDRLSAKLNYRLEQRMQQYATEHGAEALYLLQHAPSED